jgi:hypothetical protein
MDEKKEGDDMEEGSDGTISDPETELTLKSALSGEIGPPAQVRRRRTRSSRGSSKVKKVEGV